MTMFLSANDGLSFAPLLADRVLMRWPSGPITKEKLSHTWVGQFRMSIMKLLDAAWLMSGEPKSDVPNKAATQSRRNRSFCHRPQGDKIHGLPSVLAHDAPKPAFLLSVPEDKQSRGLTLNQGRDAFLCVNRREMMLLIVPFADND